MFASKLAACAAAAMLVSTLSFGPAAAAMSPPAFHTSGALIERVDCAAGFHVGPVGACILGSDNPPPPPPAVVVEQPPAVVQNPDPVGGCQSETVKKENARGDSVTHTATNCN